MLSKRAKPSTLALLPFWEKASTTLENWYYLQFNYSTNILMYILFLLFLKLAHPVLESLKNHENNWLVDLLFIMNAGDLVAFHKLKPKWSTQADLANNERIILQKITLLALMEV